MKHWLRQYEALALARMKRSAFFVLNVPKGTLHSRRRLHSSCAVKRASFRQNKKPPCWVVFVWRRRRDSNSRTVLPVTRFPIARARPTTRLLHSHIVHLFSKRLVIISQHFRVVNIIFAFYFLL